MYRAKYSKLFCYPVLTTVILIFFTTILFGQDKHDNKIDKVKGNVEKITIKTDEGTFTFEGNDAKNLLKKMKSDKIRSFKLFSSEDDSDADIFMIHPDKMDKDFSFLSEEMKDGNKVKIKIEKEDGEKVVTVTTTDKDGKEKTETYKGKEAEEFLHKKGDKKFNLRWLNEDDKDGNVFLLRRTDGKDSDDDSDIMIWNTGDSTKSFSFRTFMDGKGMEKKIKVTEENGEKIVTVTTKDKNGKEQTETYKGDEAEEYLKKNDMKLRFKVEGDEDGVVKEIIIRKKKNKED